MHNRKTQRTLPHRNGYAQSPKKCGTAEREIGKCGDDGEMETRMGAHARGDLAALAVDNRIPAREFGFPFPQRIHTGF